MNVIAIIPARGGSERIPGKNLMPVAGRPLLAHTVEHALAAAQVNETLVSTDDQEIANLAAEQGALVVSRPAALSGPEASSEDALLHALDAREAEDPDLVVFLQATCPARHPGEVDAAIDLLRTEEADSLFSAHREIVYAWSKDERGPESISYDWRCRPRSQEMTSRWRENGSIYVFRPSVLRENMNRLGGKIVVYEMDFWSSFDLDTPEEVELLDWILRSGKMNRHV